MFRRNRINTITAKRRLAVTIMGFILCALIGMTPVGARAVPTSPRVFYSGGETIITGASPTTGLWYTGLYQPMLVQVSNAPGARPAWNLSEADIVYEMPYWSAGHTDYVALYSDQHPDMVGPVRTARLHTAQILCEWDCPFIFWGSQPDTYDGVLAFLAKQVPDSLIFDGSAEKSSAVFSRASGSFARPSPHNAAADLSALAEEYYPLGYAPQKRAFSFSEITPMGEDTAVEISIRYGDGFNPSYTFNEALDIYERSYNGLPQIDGYTGKRIAAANVIVLRMNISYPGGTGSRPLYEETGGGTADVYVGGNRIAASWSRENLSDPTVFTDEFGEEIILKPGKTFIQIIPASLEYTYATDAGTTVSRIGASVEN